MGKTSKMHKTITIYLTIFLLFVCHCETKAQGIQTHCDIKKYNYFTNLAELQILDSSYKKALAFYDSAFSYSNSSFYRERFNYMVCNAVVGNYEKCRTTLIYLLEKGMNKNLVLDNPAFSSFLLSSYGEDFHKLDLKPTYDISLRQKYDSLLMEDQRLRKLNRHHYRDFYGFAIDKIDSSNIVCMLDLISKHGWPTIDNIGIPEDNIFEYEAIIIHQGDPRYQLYNFTKDLMSAYEDCDIEGDRAYKLVRQSNNHSATMENLMTIVYDSLGKFNKDSLNSFPNKTGFFKLDAQEISQIEKERALFGLESVSDFQLKVLYGMRDKRFNLAYTAGKEVLVYSNLFDYEYACKNLDSTID